MDKASQGGDCYRVGVINSRQNSPDLGHFPINFFGLGRRPFHGKANADMVVIQSVRDHRQNLELPIGKQCVG